MALRELRVNKLRTFLSLFGISIGILCMISIFSSMDSLQNNVQSSINRLGQNVIYIDKFPWGVDEDDKDKNNDEHGEMQWLKYLKRPAPTYEEMKMIQSVCYTPAAVAIVMWMDGKTVKRGSRSFENITVCTPSHDYDKVQNLEFKSGRYFTANESSSGNKVAIIGSDIAENLFGLGIDPVGSTIDMMNDKFFVIGVFKKEGQSILQITNDNVVMVPFNYIKTKVDLHSERLDLNIIAKAKSNVSLNEMHDELKGVMRAERRLPPKIADNFALNKLTIVSQQISSVFGVIDLAGFIIGFFAILVGGFGIANIMFVSVRERTNLIGIKKALGAKNYIILLEFLLEAMILSIIGGMIGLFFVWLIVTGLSNVIHFDLVLDSKNIFVGIFTSALIGIIAGFFPAWIASRMDPVVAIRFK